MASFAVFIGLITAILLFAQQKTTGALAFTNHIPLSSHISSLFPNPQTLTEWVTETVHKTLTTGTSKAQGTTSAPSSWSFIDKMIPSTSIAPIGPAVTPHPGAYLTLSDRSPWQWNLICFAVFTIIVVATPFRLSIKLNRRRSNRRESEKLDMSEDERKARDATEMLNFNREQIMDVLKLRDEMPHEVFILMVAACLRNPPSKVSDVFDSFRYFTEDIIAPGPSYVLTVIKSWCVSLLRPLWRTAKLGFSLFLWLTHTSISCGRYTSRTLLGWLRWIWREAASNPPNAAFTAEFQEALDENEISRLVQALPGAFGPSDAPEFVSAESVIESLNTKMTSQEQRIKDLTSALAAERANTVSSEEKLADRTKENRALKKQSERAKHALENCTCDSVGSKSGDIFSDEAFSARKAQEKESRLILREHEKCPSRIKEAVKEASEKAKRFEAAALEHETCGERYRRDMKGTVSYDLACAEFDRLTKSLEQTTQEHQTRINAYEATLDQERITSQNHENRSITSEALLKDHLSEHNRLKARLDHVEGVNANLAQRRAELEIQLEGFRALQRNAQWVGGPDTSFSAGQSVVVDFQPARPDESQTLAPVPDGLPWSNPTAGEPMTAFAQTSQAPPPATYTMPVYNPPRPTTPMAVDNALQPAHAMAVDSPPQATSAMAVDSSPQAASAMAMDSSPQAASAMAVDSSPQATNTKPHSRGPDDIISISSDGDNSAMLAYPLSQPNGSDSDGYAHKGYFQGDDTDSDEDFRNGRDPRDRTRSPPPNRGQSTSLQEEYDSWSMFLPKARGDGSQRSASAYSYYSRRDRSRSPSSERRPARQQSARPDTYSSRHDRSRSPSSERRPARQRSISADTYSSRRDHARPASPDRGRPAPIQADNPMSMFLPPDRRAALQQNTGPISSYVRREWTPSPSPDYGPTPTPSPENSAPAPAPTQAVNPSFMVQPPPKRAARQQDAMTDTSYSPRDRSKSLSPDYRPPTSTVHEPSRKRQERDVSVPSTQEDEDAMVDTSHERHERSVSVPSTQEDADAMVDTSHERRERSVSVPSTQEDDDAMVDTSHERRERSRSPTPLYAPTSDTAVYAPLGHPPLDNPSRKRQRERSVSVPSTQEDTNPRSMSLSPDRRAGRQQSGRAGSDHTRHDRSETSLPDYKSSPSDRDRRMTPALAQDEMNDDRSMREGSNPDEDDSDDRSMREASNPDEPDKDDSDNGSVETPPLNEVSTTASQSWQHAASNSLQSNVPATLGSSQAPNTPHNGQLTVPSDMALDKSPAYSPISEYDLTELFDDAKALANASPSNVAAAPQGNQLAFTSFRGNTSGDAPTSTVAAALRGNQLTFTSFRDNTSSDAPTKKTPPRAKSPSSSPQATNTPTPLAAPRRPLEPPRTGKTMPELLRDWRKTAAVLQAFNQLSTNDTESEKDAATVGASKKLSTNDTESEKDATLKAFEKLSTNDTESEKDAATLKAFEKLSTNDTESQKDE